MVVRFCTYFISLWMLVGASSLFAVIYKIDEWVKESEGNQQQVICFSDMHCDYGNQQITDKQRADIIAAAKKRNAFVIVEDHDVVDDGIGVLQQKHNATVECDSACDYGYMQQLPNSIIDVSPLRGLIKACNTCRIPCSNVEFRQYAYNQHDLEPFKLSVKNDRRYREIQEKNKRASDRVKVTLTDVAAGLKKIEKEIAGYIDQDLKDYYAEIERDKRAPVIKEAIQEALSYNEACSYQDFIEIIRTAIKKAGSKYEEDQKTTAAGKAMNGLDIQQRVDARVVHHATLFDSWIDARIMHRVAQSKSDAIFVCAGGLHIEAIAKGLTALGYTLKKSKGERLHYNTEEDIRTVIEHQSIDIADYFNKKPAQPAPVLQQPKRFSYWHMVCATAVVATLSYLCYRYWC